MGAHALKVPWRDLFAKGIIDGRGKENKRVTNREAAAASLADVRPHLKRNVQRG